MFPREEDAAAMAAMTTVLAGFGGDERELLAAAKQHLRGSVAVEIGQSFDIVVFDAQPRHAEATGASFAPVAASWRHAGVCGGGAGAAASQV